MTRPTLILLALAAMAVGFGLTHSPGSSVNGELPSIDTGRGERGGGSNHEGWPGRVGQPSETRASVSEIHTGTAAAPDMEGASVLPLAFETEADKAPIYLGEPRDVNDDQAASSTAAQAYPIAIGAELDADDPFAVEPSSAARSPMQVGQSLHVDDPQWARHSMASQDPIVIGPDLDANDPWSWALRNPPNTPVEIGRPLAVRP